MFRNALTVTTFVISLLFVQQLGAQTKKDPFTIGLWGVKTEYIGDLGNNVFKFGSDFKGGGAFSFDYYLSRFFDVGIYGSLSSTGMNNGISAYTNFDEWIHRSEYNNEVQNFKVERLSNFNVHTRFKIGGDKFRLVPYLGVAAGVVFYDKLQTRYIDVNGDERIMSYQRPDGGWHDVNSVTALTLGGIVGLEYKLSQVVSIRYQAIGSCTDNDNRDFYVKGSNDLQLQHHIGFTFSFNGKKKDTNVPAVTGCPNRCPKVVEPPKEKVKPVDTDSDGVPDYLDLCPDTPEGVQVDANGCPVDTDGDGVPDYLDNCPDEFGLPENDGCPFHPVLFEFGKAGIEAPETRSKLDSIANLLVRQTACRVIISGHTDSIGSKAYNQQLSEKRAEAVKHYLVKSGIEENRITTNGYGSTQPVTNNQTKEGRAQNRRADILIILKE